MRYIYNKVEQECIKRGVNNIKIEFNVVNEMWHGVVYSQKLGGRNNAILLSFQKAIEVRTAIVNEKRGDSPNIQIALGISHADSHYVGGEGYKQLHEIMKMLAGNNLYIDYIDLHAHEKDVLALPEIRLIDEAIRSFSEYKNLEDDPIVVSIGEYDLNIMKWENDPQRFLKQAERYYAVFNVFLNAGVKEITLWGVADDESWYEHEDEIEAEYYSPNANALVFDDNGKPKLNYYAILTSMQQNVVL